MARGMDPDDLYRIAWVSDARVAPGGERIACVVTHLDREADDARSDIWLVGTDGSGAARRLTAGAAKNANPRWSPDGTHVAFTSDRGGGRPQLYLIAVDGGEARRVTDLVQGAGSPLWSPDGRTIAFVTRTGSDAVPNGADTAGTAPKTKPARLITTVKYRANGEGFIYDRRRHLFVVDVAGGAVRQVTDGDWDDIQPAWSPDSRALAFISARHDTRDLDDRADLFVVELERGTTRQVTPGGGSWTLPAWSPDGELIACLGTDDAAGGPCNARLWLVPATGGAPRLLSGAIDRDLAPSDSATPQWSADGRMVVTGVQEHGTVGVLAFGTADRTVTRLVHGERTVQSFDLDPTTGTLALVLSDERRPAEVFVRDAAGTERQLTDFNGGWLADVELPALEPFTVQSDGVAIDAWIMRPAGFREGVRYPALLNIHGGPFAQYGPRFFDEFSVQSGAGYVVVCCNPRGSSGRDDRFTRAILGCPGEPDAADILATMDEALRRFDFIDPARTGVLGGSYGGYLTAWIVGRTDRFAAAAPERGLYNRFSKDGTSDIWSGWTYLRVRPWEDPALYWRYSPIARVREMRTPMLILHSEDDLRCPIEQAEQLFVALKQQGRDVRFVRFPGEHHDLSRSGRPSHRVERFGFLLGWFREKLAAGAADPDGRQASATPTAAVRR